MTNHILFVWYFLIGRVFWLLPINRRKVLFVNFFGKGYGDSPKYIAECLSHYSDVQLIWLIKKGTDVNSFPKRVKVVQRGTLSELFHIATSGVWIDNSRKHYGIRKRRGQYYIQTWHGGIALKKIEKDVEDELPKHYIKSAINDSKMINVLLSSSRYSTEIFKRCFWYMGPIYECGTPRSDAFFSDSVVTKKKVYSSFGISEKCNIVLYAPTFRDNGDISPYLLEFDRLLLTAKEKTNENWIVIVRLHPNISELSKRINFSSYVLDGTNYPDINELLISCKLLITDYSSCMFDAMLCGKKVILYTSDIEQYTKNRGFYFDINSLPFPAIRNMNEIDDAFDYINSDNYDDIVDMFKSKLGMAETGQASEYVCQLIENAMRAEYR